MNSIKCYWLTIYNIYLFQIASYNLNKKLQRIMLGLWPHNIHIYFVYLFIQRLLSGSKLEINLVLKKLFGKRKKK